MQESSRKPRQAASQGGFTILEILVVIFILGLVGTISLYAFQTSRPRIQLTNTAREVTTFMNRARLTAIRLNRDVTISVETSLDGQVTPYNPTGIEQEFMVLSVTNASGVREEISSFLLPKSFPPIYVWGHGEPTVHGGTGITFPSNEMTYASDGTVNDTGAFRFSIPRTGSRNIIEVAVLTKSGSRVIRKFLEAADRPPSATTQEYFVETTASSTGKNLWVWY